MGASQNKRISIKGGVFRMMVGGQETAKSDERFLHVVVVAAAPAVSRTFYAEKYVEGETLRPSCWSSDGVRPDSGVEKPQSSTCADCPQNIAGSGEKNSRACRYTQRLAVVLANDFNGDVFQLTLPATSIFGKPEGGKMPLQSYVRYLAAHGVNIEDVVTEVRFDTDAAVPTLTFSPVRPLEEHEHNLCSLKAQTTEAKGAITMTVAQTDGVVEKRLSKPAIAAASAAKVEKAPAEAIEEPTKRATKKQEESAGKSVEELVGEWDD
jgi:hypothetical protein